MEFESFTYQGNDGQTYLRHWAAFYPEIIRSGKYEFREEPACPIYLKDYYYYIKDLHGEIVWESGRKKEDLEFLDSIILDVKLEHFNKYYHPGMVPWLEIGIWAASVFRRKKRDLDKIEFEKRRKEAQRLASGLLDQIPDYIHLLKSGNEWVDMAIQEKDRESLWGSLWKENEICILFADSNIGKSIYAVQIAFEIAKSRKVIYFDYEMDFKDFQKRYTGLDGKKYPIPACFLRCEPNRDIFLNPCVEDIIAEDIEKIVKKEGAKIIIIDNLTFINKNTRSSTAISLLVYKLKKMQKKYGLSILLLAHTSKRNPRLPLSQNDLSGNKKLFNFMDSVFAIGQSVDDENLQYLKQLKSRGDRIEYGADNVILLERTFSDNWLHFETIGYDREINHLKKSKEEEFARLKTEIMRLEKEGLSQREMAKILNTSLCKINRIRNSPEKSS